MSFQNTQELRGHLRIEKFEMMMMINVAQKARIRRMASRANIPARLTAGCNIKPALVQYAARQFTGTYTNGRKLAEVKDKSGPSYSHRPLPFQYLLQWPKIRKPSRDFFGDGSLSPSGAGDDVMRFFRKLGICMGHSVDSGGACVCVCVVCLVSHLQQGSEYLSYVLSHCRQVFRLNGWALRISIPWSKYRSYNWTSYFGCLFLLF